MNKVFVYDKECQDCRNNPNGKEPYAPMKRLNITDLEETVAYKEAQEQKVQTGCILCRAIRVLVRLPPEESLRVLEDRC